MANPIRCSIYQISSFFAHQQKQKLICALWSVSSRNVSCALMADNVDVDVNDQ